MKLSKKEKWNKLCFWGIVAVSFIAIWIYNILTPLMSDDLLFDRSLYHSVWDIFYQEYLQYFHWTGRSVLQICLKCASLMPKSIFNIINSLMFVCLSLLIYMNIQERKKNDYFLYLAIQLFLWLGTVEFGQTILWLGGACNYLWGIVIILSFITLSRVFLSKPEKKYSLYTLIVFFFLGILAGWGNENTSGGAILIVVLLWLNDYLERKVWNKNVIFGFIGACIGFCFLIFSPSNKVRAGLMASEETYVGLASFVSRGLKIMQVYQQYFFVFLASIILVCFYMIQKHVAFSRISVALIFTFSGLATGAVLLFTPQPMNRAYFGAGIFFIIALLQLLWDLPQYMKRDFVIVRNGWILVGVLWLIFTYVENGANLTRILRDVKERDQLVAEELNRDWRDVVLPKLHPEFNNPYTYLYDNDVQEDIHWWINEVYCQHYGLDTITAVEREEWDKTHE